LIPEVNTNRRDFFVHQLGIDISKEKFDVCLLSETGKQKEKAFANKLFGFKQLLVWLEQNASGEIHACMEGTGKLWEALAEYLHEHGFAVSVVNPAKIKGFGQSELRRSKTDILDAGLIARFCKLHCPQQWRPPTPQVKAIRDRQRYIDALKDHRVQEYNRVQAGPIDAQVRECIDRHIAFLDEEIKRFEKELLQFVKANYETNRQFTLLTSILSIGPVTALTVMGELGKLDQFATARQLEVFCGLTPLISESGSSVRKRSKISKIGNWRVRKALYMPAVCAIRSNPNIAAFAARLRAAGKPAKVIICAVMRKLLRIIFAVLRSDAPYVLDCDTTPPLAVRAAV
jgi:transposase